LPKSPRRQAYGSVDRIAVSRSVSPAAGGKGCRGVGKSDRAVGPLPRTCEAGTSGRSDCSSDDVCASTAREEGLDHVLFRGNRQDDDLTAGYRCGLIEAGSRRLPIRRSSNTRSGYPSHDEREHCDQEGRFSHDFGSRSTHERTLASVKRSIVASAMRTRSQLTSRWRGRRTHCVAGPDSRTGNRMTGRGRVDAKGARIDPLGITVRRARGALALGAEAECTESEQATTLSAIAVRDRPHVRVRGFRAAGEVVRRPRRSRRTAGRHGDVMSGTSMRNALSPRCARASRVSVRGGTILRVC